MNITLPEAPSLPVVDEQGAAAGSFPVGRIFCVGRNYGDHAREMGHDPDLEPPFFFSKFASSLSLGPDHALPAFSEDVHHEVELVLALGSRLENATEAEALGAVVAAGVALDLTARDRQAEAKAAGRPWLVAKGFDGAAPCGVLKAGGVPPLSARIALTVNGNLRQEGALDQMLWPPGPLLAKLSALFVLEPGDLIFTGTPAGVGPLRAGDRIEGRIDGLPPLLGVIV